MFKNLNKKIKNYKWVDIGCIKWSVLFFTLMVAKLWPGILGLDWYVYMVFAIILMIRPVMVLFKK